MLQHLRESFPLSRGGATPYRFLLIHYISNYQDRCRLKGFQTAFFRDVRFRTCSSRPSVHHVPRPAGYWSSVGCADSRTCRTRC
ncbi:hypothetical protein D0D82_10840 [Neisseria gonorrhoeae]